MTMRIAFVVLLGLAGACGGDGGEDMQPPHACAKRTGLYRDTWTVQSGNCGQQNESIVNADEGGPEVDRTSCVIAFDTSPVVNGGLSITATGKMTWSADASVGTGTVYLEARDAGTGAVVCTGVYTLTSRRI